ncbi:MAG: hypothetical protein QW165_04545 [Candidatus Woesearchaeota archaeon]
MTSETETVNYAEEANNTRGDYVKLDVGVHKFTFLEELKKPRKIKKSFNGKEQEIEQTDVLVDYQGKRKTLTLTVGHTLKSLWKQLMILGEANKGLCGKTITVLVTVIDGKKTHNVQEAQELIARRQQQKMTGVSQ